MADALNGIMNSAAMANLGPSGSAAPGATPGPVATHKAHGKSGHKKTAKKHTGRRHRRGKKASR